LPEAADDLAEDRVRDRHLMATISKRASRAWLSEIRQVLNQDWNPISGAPSNEYDSYVGTIAAMIRDNASDEKFLEYLKWAEVEQMGIPVPFNRSRALSVITALRAIGSPPV
jgi:hypothetical protein